MTKTLLLKHDYRRQGVHPKILAKFLSMNLFVLHFLSLDLSFFYVFQSGKSKPSSAHFDSVCIENTQGKQ